MPFRPNDMTADVLRDAPAGARLRRRARRPAHERDGSASPDVVLRRYASFAALGAEDVVLLHALRNGQTSVTAGQDIESEGMPARTPRLILSGWACRFRMLSDGRRMILGFLLPGDAIALRARGRAPLVSAAAVTACRLADATPLWRAVHARDQANTPLAQAQHAIDLQDESYLLDHVVRLGRQTALERVCHLLLELHWRLDAVGLVRAREFPMPLTQEALADAVGLSVVHVNRTLQRLRRERMMECRRGCVALLQPERMAAIAEFKPPCGAPLMRAPTAAAGD